MLKIEKTVFISYRRTNSFHALAIFKYLHAHGYDVFIDFDGINTGAFDQIIINQIKARAHFIVILTPSALERCTDPTDWLRREILTAIEYKRNIVPVFFDGFDWKNDVVAQLPDDLKPLAVYNGLPVPSSLIFFDTAMDYLQTKCLNVAIDDVLHPTPPAEKNTVAQKIVEATNQPTVTEAQLSASEHFEHANQHQIAGQYDDAIADYTKAIRLNPQYADAYVNRGVAYRKKKGYDHAIQDYNKAIDINPQDADAYNNRGLAYYYKKDYDRAIADYTEAIRLNSQYADAYNNRGNAYDDKKDYDRAIADYTEAIRLNPQYANAYVNRGSAYHNGKKDYDRAIADYECALQIDPNFEMARNNREIALRMKRGG